MAVCDFNQLRKKYGEFRFPAAVVRVNDKKIQGDLSVSDIEVELSCGFEASAAEFSIYNAYHKQTGSFDFEAVKKYIFLGSKVDVYLGYDAQATNVFTGVVTRVSFRHEKMEIPCVRVTAMDIKGVMMSGSYAAQLKAASFSEAVKEILSKTAYEKLKAKDIIKSVRVSDTPDQLAILKGERKKDRTLEMTAESDYEFVVKAAKKYNFEFYTECGNVIFRNAKSDETELLSIGPSTGLRSFDISYDLTGLVETVNVRSPDVTKAGFITARKKLNQKISFGNKARPVIKGSRRVYLDSTVTSKEEAMHRADSLAERAAYRFGSLECEMTGIPELLPGHFITVSGLGGAADNRFYLTKVRHLLRGDGGFSTCLTGVAAEMRANGSIGHVR